MSLNVTIDVNGKVIERLSIRQVLRDYDADVATYTVTEFEGGLPYDVHEYKKAIRHRRADGGFKLAARAIEFVMQERKRRHRKWRPTD